jgi:hypothetical protein
MSNNDETIRAAGTEPPTREPAHETHAALAERFQRDAVPLMDRLFGTALRLTRNRADAEDLVQETMLRAYIGFRAFEAAPISMRGYPGFCTTPGSMPTANNRAGPWRLRSTTSLSFSQPITRPPLQPDCARPKSKCSKPCPTTKSRQHCWRYPNKSGWQSITPTSRTSPTRRSPTSWARPKAR